MKETCDLKKKKNERNLWNEYEWNKNENNGMSRRINNIVDQFLLDIVDEYIFSLQLNYLQL